MSVISIRLNSQEEAIIKSYAESKNSTVSQLIKELLFEKIESEYDLKICEEYLAEKEKGSLELISFEEAAETWDIK